MLARDAEQTIRTLLRVFPIITLTGPSQSGKTTLASISSVMNPVSKKNQIGKHACCLLKV